MRWCAYATKCGGEEGGGGLWEGWDDCATSQGAVEAITASNYAPVRIAVHSAWSVKPGGDTPDAHSTNARQ